MCAGCRRHCSCDAPQELPDEDIDRLLEIEASSKFVAAAKRPPLESCSSLQFTSDLTAFLEWRSELSLAKQIRENRVMWCVQGPCTRTSPLRLPSVLLQLLECPEAERPEDGPCEKPQPARRPCSTLGDGSVFASCAALFSFF